MQTIDKPTFTLDTEDHSDLQNGHGWPNSLCIIEVSPGKYACNNADTKGKESDAQIDLKGLAVHLNEDSATRYMGAINGLSGTIVPKTFDECRQIVVDKPQLHAMFLMDGNVIRDIVYVR